MSFEGSHNTARFLMGFSARSTSRVEMNDRKQAKQWLTDENKTRKWPSKW